MLRYSIFPALQTSAYSSGKSKQGRTHRLCTFLLQVAVFRMQPQQGGGLYSPDSASRRKSASSEKVLVQSLPNLRQLASEKSLSYVTQQTL